MTANVSVFNPPSFQKIQALKENRVAVKLPLTAMVREGLQATLDDAERYAEFCTLYNGGAISGNAMVDVYTFATALVAHERRAGRTGLDVALEAGTILKSDIVKRIAPELKKLRLDVHRGVLRGFIESSTLSAE